MPRDITPYRSNPRRYKLTSLLRGESHGGSYKSEKGDDLESLHGYNYNILRIKYDMKGVDVKTFSQDDDITTTLLFST